MLIERYIANQTSLLPEPLQAVLASKVVVKKLANLKRLICIGTSVFESPQPVLTRYFAVQDQTLYRKQEVLQIAGSLVSRQRDKFYQALTLAAQEANLPIREPEIDAEEPVLLARLDHNWYVLSDQAGMESEGIELGVTSSAMAAQMESEGCQVLFLAQKQPKRLLGIFALQAPLLSEAIITARALQDLGIELVMISNEKTRIANGIAKQLGINLIRSELGKSEEEELLISLTREAKESGVLSNVSGYLKAPAAAFAILIDTRKTASDNLVIPSLSLLPEVIVVARTIAKQIKHRFFWIKF